MIPVEILLSFFGIAVLLATSPGPDNLFVLTQSIMNGKKAGYSITAGLCTGLIAHTTAVAIGVAAIFQTSELAFSLLKYCGAAYLLYLAWQAFNAPISSSQTSQQNKLSLSKLYLRGIVMNITNPKVSIFFLAFLPQFADPKRGSVAIQILQLGVVFIFAAALVFSFFATLSGFIGQFLRSNSKTELILNKLAATLYIGLAAKLALSER